MISFHTAPPPASPRNNKLKGRFCFPRCCRRGGAAEPGAGERGGRRRGAAAWCDRAGRSRCGVRGTRGRLASSRRKPMNPASTDRLQRASWKSLPPPPPPPRAAGGSPRSLPRPASRGINRVWPFRGPGAEAPGSHPPSPPSGRPGWGGGRAVGSSGRAERSPGYITRVFPLLSPVIPG